MSFSSDVKAFTTKDSGHKINGRSRLQGVQYVHGGLSAGITLSFLDMSTDGTAVTATATNRLTLTTSSAIGTEDVFIPDNGILFDKGIYMTNGNTADITSVTVFYVGGGEV